MLTRTNLQFDACVVGIVGLEGGERVYEARGVLEQHGSCLATSLNHANVVFRDMEQSSISASYLGGDHYIGFKGCTDCSAVSCGIVVPGQVHKM